MDIACGVVLFNTPADDQVRLGKSCITGAGLAQLDCEMLSIDNSADHGVCDDPQTLGMLPSLGNVGFGAGHNMLMRTAFERGAKAYLALNPDGFLHPQAITRLWHRSLAEDGRVLLEARQFPQEHPKHYDPGTLATPWCSGACLLITKEIYERTAGFDEGFFMYCEDVDLSWRVRLQGLPCRIAADAYYFHDVIDRPETGFTRWHMALSMKRLLSKWSDRSHRRLAQRLDWALRDIPESEIERGSKIADGPLHDAVGSGIPNFENYFGFGEFRWQ